MFFHLFSENFQNVLGPCVSDTALILVNPVYKESRFSSKQTRIKLVPNSSVIPNNLFKMSSPTFCDVVAVRLLSVGAAKLKDLSKNVLEQFLLSGGITNNKSSLAERVFVELLFFLLIQTNTWEQYGQQKI